RFAAPGATVSPFGSSNSGLVWEKLRLQCFSTCFVPHLETLLYLI
ncbi:hypothetical protein L195_g043317, partial [Trifolium pratense]